MQSVGTTGAGRGGTKPVSECKGVDQSMTFSGDQTKFREWSEHLLNAPAQLKNGYRGALK
eukprot:1819964-Pyramimonas_sp.AAC.1